jgi:hypothetical protein
MAHIPGHTEDWFLPEGQREKKKEDDKWYLPDKDLFGGEREGIEDSPEGLFLKKQFEESKEPDWLDLDEWIPDDYADITRLIANSVGGGLAELAMFPLYTGKAAWDFGATEGGIGDRSKAALNAFMSMPEYEQIFGNKLGRYTLGNEDKYKKAEFWGRLGSMFVPGVGIINAARRIPKIGRFLQEIAPSTMMGSKGIVSAMKGKFAPLKEIAREVGNAAWNSAQNLALIGGAGHLENKYEIADKVGRFMGRPAKAAEMDIDVPSYTPSHPREMMEMANRRGFGNARGGDGLEVTLDLPYGPF